MGAVVGTSILLFLQFFSLVHGTFQVPRLDISPKALQKYLCLGDNITIDVPALYVFGDATVDAGNSPHLNPKKAGELIPFGQCLPGIPKGRVTNGRTIVDFISQLVGLPFSPPALGMSDAEKQNTKTGINYASQSSSINSYVPSVVEAQMGKSLCFDQQIDLFEKTTQDLKTQFRSNDDYSQYMSKSLFFINIGSDDFALAWDMVFSHEHNNTPDAYARSISNKLQGQLLRLYQLGARKFVVNNVPPLGCQPFVIHVRKATTECVEDMNELVSTYNKLLSDLLAKLQSTLPESKFVLADVFKVFEDAIASPGSYGFDTAKVACCSLPISPFQLACVSSSVCKDQNSRLYFDPSHPSERMHFVWASRLLNDSSVCSPLNLLQLMQA